MIRTTLSSVLLLAGLCLGLPTAAAGASSFGCKGLENSRELPSVEGRDGFFFRVFADLRMQHPMSDEVTTQLGQLAAALKAHGTTLIYVPIPTKSQALPDYLPEESRLYGFDRDVAIAVYKDQITRLHAAGVVAVDLLDAFAGMDLQTPPFHRADFHWTSDGARRAAETIGATIRALPDYAEVEPVRFASTETGEELSVSGMRRTLQAFCVDNLPPVVTRAYETVEVASTEATLDIFGKAAAAGGADEVALVGTSFSDADVPNFSGFLAEYASMAVSNQAITGGNQFGAITSYLTSRAFTEARPRYLVWENPIYNNLAQFGVGPMTELIAAARNDCTPIAPEAIRPEGSTGIAVDLTSTPLELDQVLLADAGTDGSRDAIFRFETGDGRVLSQAIRRGDRVRASGRFFIPLEPLMSRDLSRLVVTFDRADPATASVSLCNL